MWGSTRGKGKKGQSSPIAVVLVFGLVIASTTIVVLAGGSAIESTQSQLGTATAENSMTQLDSQAALVALGQSESQQVALGANTNGGYRVDESAGTMTVEHRTAATTDQIFSKDLGAVTYESEAGTTIAYQGGGVWRSSGDGESVMVSPPEFHYRGSTLTLPVVTINHGEQITDRAVIRRNNTTQHYPNQTRGNINPVDDGRIFVTVESDYYRAWGEYFAERTDGVVEYDHPNNQVTVELVTPIRQTTTSSAVAGLSSGDLKTQGNGGLPCGDTGPGMFYTDSYDSSGTTDDYCDQYPGSTGENGNVTFGGDVDYQGNADFYGNIRSGGDVDITGNADIEGDIYWTGSFSAGGSATYDSEQQISGVETQPKINRIVGTNSERIADSNDNDGANDAYDAITGGPDPEMNFGGVGSTVEIDNEGEYHLERLDIGSGQTVVLDTDDGDITIAVDEYVNVDGTLEVVGDNTVRIYVRTMGPSGKVSTGWRDAGLRVHGGAVEVRDDNSPQLRVYGNDTFNASIDDGQFSGVVWAPVGTDGPGGFRIEKSDVYGGVVTGDVVMDTKGRIHYDQALKGEEIISADESVTEITYLHVSTNEINITSG